MTGPSNPAFASLLRPRLRLLVLAALAVTLFAAAAFARKKKAPPGPPDLPTRVNNLARRLFGVPEDESEPIAGQIQKLVLDDLEQWFAAHPASAEKVEKPIDVPYDVKVRRELEHDFSLLHYPLLGRPAAFVQEWAGKNLIGAGYTLGWTDQDRVNTVALFEEQAGKTRLAALTHFVPGPDLHYAFLSPPGAPAGKSFRFLVYGSRLGKSHPRLTAVLYSFDGESLKPLWKREDAYDGTLTVEGDRVKINYMKEDEFIQAGRENRQPPRHEAIYQVSPGGLTLLEDHQLPEAAAQRQ